jgi:hypothetical protein
MVSTVPLESIDFGSDPEPMHPPTGLSDPHRRPQRSDAAAPTLPAHIEEFRPLTASAIKPNGPGARSTAAAQSPTVIAFSELSALASTAQMHAARLERAARFLRADVVEQGARLRVLEAEVNGCRRRGGGCCWWQGSVVPADFHALMQVPLEARIPARFPRIRLRAG